MSSLTFAGLRYKVLVALSLLVALAMSVVFIGVSSAHTPSADASTAQGNTTGPSAVSNSDLLNQSRHGTSAAPFLLGQSEQAPEVVYPITTILGEARRFAVFHGIETGHPAQVWRFEKSYLWGDIGVGPGVLSNFKSDSTVIGDCYEQPGQAVGKGCADITPHNSSPPHVDPTYRDFSVDLVPVVQDIRAAVTYVDGLPATQTLERIADKAIITSAACGTVNVIRVAREVNVGGANHGITIQGCPTDVFIFDVSGPWASSGGRVALSGGVSASNILWVFKGRLQNSGNGGWAGTAIFDTADGVDNAGKDLSCFDCALLVLNGKLNTTADANLRWHPFIIFDYGDAPKRYSTVFDALNGVARHKYTPSGPRLGSVWNGETDGQPTGDASSDAGDDGVRNLPLIVEYSTDPVAMTVYVTNPNLQSVATVACWIDFNRDDDFLDDGEGASAPVGNSVVAPIPVTLTFSGFLGPQPGPSYLRCRISTNENGFAAPVTSIPPVAPSPGLTKPMFPLVKSSYELNDGWPNGEVEDYVVTIEKIGDLAPDYGDAPDTGIGTGQGNYITLIGDSGPKHYIEEGLYLGVTGPDLEFGTLQNTEATADDTNTLDDEDGIATLPAISAQSTSVQLSVVATNITENSGRLRCWIDFNRNGSFGDAGEVSPLSTVNANSGSNPYTLTFSGFSAPTPGVSYIRCRTAHAPSDLAQVVAYSGEIEDHRVMIAP